MALAATPTTQFLDRLATALETAYATNLKVGLFIGSPTLGPDLVLADLTEPGFTGYARAAVTLGTRRGNANGDIILPIASVTFQPTVDPVSEIIVTGWFLAEGASPTIPELAEYLDVPWVVDSTINALDINEEIYIRADPNYGGYCSTCTT